MRETPPILEMLSKLIATPSVSSIDPNFDQSNLEVVSLLANWLDPLGFDVQVIPLETKGNKYNLVAKIGEGEGGLILAGHTDTVPANEDLWGSDPFELVEKNERFVGLGTSDMKGFFALAIRALQEVSRSTVAAPLYIVATADEESSMAGAKELAEKSLLSGGYAIIGEPTSLKPVRKHKGIITSSITVTGESGHASEPRNGKNAVLIMHAVITELEKYFVGLKETQCDPDFSIPYPTINYGSINGGDSPNRICARCTIQIDIRMLPSMSESKMMVDLKEVVGRIAKNYGAQVSVDEIYAPLSSYEVPGNSNIVRAVEKLSGHCASCVNFGTEAPFYQKIGVEPVVFGPGDITCAHKPNEYIDALTFDPTIRYLQHCIKQFCIDGA